MGATKRLHDPPLRRVYLQIRISPTYILFHEVFLCGKTSLEDISVKEYAKLDVKKATGVF